MYDNYKFYGPYKCKDGRLRIIGIDENGTHHTISYPKYLKELHIGRYLEKGEEVDHIDGNPLNNSLENLQIVIHGNHQSLDAKRNRDVIAVCRYCGKSFIIKGSKIHCRNRRDRHQSGYFCSKECSGKYGKNIQLKIDSHTKIPKIIPQRYKRKYSLLDIQF